MNKLQKETQQTSFLASLNLLFHFQKQEFNTFISRSKLTSLSNKELFANSSRYSFQY